MKPLLVSACLLGVKCKYSGGDNLCPAVAALAERFWLIPVCPEQMGGLPTPRPASERSGDRIVSRDGTDVTEQFARGARETLRLAKLLRCEGAVLKSRSPSCGSGAIYDGCFTGTLIPGDGVTAQLLKKHGIFVCTELELEKLEQL